MAIRLGGPGWQGQFKTFWDVPRVLWLAGAWLCPWCRRGQPGSARCADASLPRREGLVNGGDAGFPHGPWAGAQCWNVFPQVCSSLLGSHAFAAVVFSCYFFSSFEEIVCPVPQRVSGFV